MCPAAVVGQGAIDDAQDIFPSQVGAQPAHMRHPILRRFVQPFHVAVLSRQSHLAQRRRITRTQARVAADPPLGPRAGQSGLCALADQGALELGRSAQDLQCKFPLRGCRVDRVLDGAEEGALGLQRSITSSRCDSDRASRSIRTTTSVSPLATRSSTRASTGRRDCRRGVFFKDLDTTRRFQGLRLGQGGSDPLWIRAHSRSGA